MPGLQARDITAGDGRVLWLPTETDTLQRLLQQEAMISPSSPPPPAAASGNHQKQGSYNNTEAVRANSSELMQTGTEMGPVKTSLTSPPTVTDTAGDMGSAVTKPRPPRVCVTETVGLTRAETSPRIIPSVELSTPRDDGHNHHSAPCRFNVFSKLGLFFHVEGQKDVPGPEDYRDRIVAVDNYSLLPCLLEDMLTRHLYTPAQLVQQLVDYSKGLVITQDIIPPHPGRLEEKRPPSRREDAYPPPSQREEQTPHLTGQMEAIQTSPSPPPGQEEADERQKEMENTRLHPHPVQLNQFISSLYTALSGPHWQDMDSVYMTSMEWLLASTPAAFETMFHHVLATPLRKAQCGRQRRRLQQGLATLEQFLQHTGGYPGNSPLPSLAEQPLSLGETPLMSACRHRNPDVVLLLLRHGVSGNARWMNYKSALEVLLFSPSTIQLEDEDTRDLELCLEYYLRGHDPVQIKLLEDKVITDYHVLHENWRELLPDWCYGQPRPLVQFARMCIRDSLMASGGLPTAIHRLPIPKLLCDYVDLQS